MEPRREEFYEDVLAILTLPEEDTHVLILGEQGVIGASRFLRILEDMFKEELDSVEYMESIKYGQVYKVGEHVSVMCCAQIIAGMVWDYKITLAWYAPSIHTTSSSSYPQARKYKLTKGLNEYE